jgi:hypothetical protein
MLFLRSVKIDIHLAFTNHELAIEQFQQLANSIHISDQNYEEFGSISQQKTAKLRNHPLQDPILHTVGSESGHSGL